MKLELTSIMQMLPSNKLSRITINKVIKFFISLFLKFFLILLTLIFYFLFEEEPITFNIKAAKKISYSPLTKLVPSKKIPSNLKIFASNNNVDLINYQVRRYFAFRTAPTHFASAKTILYVLSSTDNKNWEYETKFSLGSDLREPRFLLFKNKLFLYFFKGGSNPLSFAPEHIFAAEYISKTHWTKPKPIYKPGYVVWRAKEHKDKAYMSVYYGAGLYSNETKPGHLELLESDDGYNYKLVNNQEVSSEVSAEEGEFEFDNEGNLYATIRLEMKGSKICTAGKNNIVNWNCKFTTYKYDSALMFKHKNDLYVVARRNIAGAYNRQTDYLPKFMRAKFYLVRYSLTRKRTTLYKLNKKKLELEPIFDFPSKGDTAYAGIAKINENKYLLVNYSSDINGFYWNWLGGQLFGSNVYETILDFSSL